MAKANGYIDTGNGTRIETLRLVERLRAFRGRLTRRMMCRAMGYPDSNKAVYVAVCRLCREYEINAADAVDDIQYLKPEVFRDIARDRVRESKIDLVSEARKRRTMLPVEKRIAVATAAKRELRRQVQLAIAEAPTAPPYKPKELAW